MILEWLLGLGAGVSEWVASIMPPIELPEQLVNIDEAINSIFAYGNGLGAWVDWSLCAVVLLVPLAVWAVGLTVRAVRVLISHVPFFGGNG